MKCSFTYNFKTMKAINTVTDQTFPMRVDTEGGMIDVWSFEANDWIWNERATEAFKNHLFSQTTGK